MTASDDNLSANMPNDRNTPSDKQHQNLNLSQYGGRVSSEMSKSEL